MPDCRICKLPNVEPETADTRTIKYKCDRCGRYGLTMEVFEAALEIDDAIRPRVSRWIRDNYNAGDIPRIDVDSLTAFKNIHSLNFMEKADRFLLFITKRTSKFGQSIPFLQSSELQALTESLTPRELHFVGSYLEDRGFIKLLSGNPDCIVTGNGFIHAEELATRATNSSQAFVAMWFDASLSGIWEDAIEPAVQAAGYKPMRIDGKEHNHKICDEIIAEIRRSRFLVADYTGHRGGVYYEAGFATGLGLPVILTCRQDYLKDLHFDVRQYNTIVWDSGPDLKLRLERRISATIGDGPHKVP